MEHRPTSRRRDRAEVLGLRTIKQRILYNDYATIIFNVPLGGNGARDGSRDTENTGSLAKPIVLGFSHVRVATGLANAQSAGIPRACSRDIVIVSHMYFIRSSDAFGTNLSG